MTRGLRVLVLIQGPLGDKLMGPEIRGWEMVKALSARYEVTAAASVTSAHERDGVPVVPRTRRSILAELRRHDVVIGPVIPPYALLAGHRCLRVADLYDPVELELATVGGWRARRQVAQQRASRALQLRWADIVLCANERQLEGIRHDLGELARPGGDPALMTIPMGLPAPPPPPSGHPLRDRFPAIAREDPLVLWWGSVWRWLDAATAVEAIGVLARRRPDIRMIITAGKPANSATDPLNVADDVRALARDRGLLDRHVFFLDDWVPFDQRHHYLADADVGITLHAATPEATLAARARYMDYAWASLPSVLAEGDDIADRLAASGAATLVPPRDPATTADALHSMLGDPERLEAARAGCRAVASEYQWSALLRPLVERVAMERTRSRSVARSLRIASEAARYYAGRAVDRGLSVR